jgi:hypothetical protein
MNRKKVFIDFDGVISDTNVIKEKNIKEAYKYVFGEYNIDFVNFFTKNNGVPRELKLNKYFNSPIIEEKILKKYFSLNKNLLDAKLSNGFLDFLKINNKSDFFILSGGDRTEIVNFLKKNNVFDIFEEILTGPKTKSQNLAKFNLTESDVFIGDAKHDFIVAKEYKLNFIFMTEFSQEPPPYSFIDQSVILTKNFITLLNK